MKLNQLLSVFSLSLLSLATATPALAIPGFIGGSQPGSKVNIRSAPSSSSQAIHYGLVGDSVEVINAAYDNAGIPWAFVQYPSGAQGWVRGDFIYVNQPQQQQAQSNSCDHIPVYEDRINCMTTGMGLPSPNWNGTQVYDTRHQH